MTCSLSAIDIGAGPFTMQIDVAIRANRHDKSLNVLAEPICKAIKDKSVLEIIIDPSNAGELKRFVVEPHLVGYTRNGEMVIQGYKIDQVTLRDEIISSEIHLNRGGTFTQLEEITDDSKTTRLSRIIRIEVLKNTHFKVRDIDLGEIDETVKVICSVHQ